jgi:hypothetical protein
MVRDPFQGKTSALPRTALLTKLVKVAIVGGTGAYRHVHGFARVDTTDGEVTFVLTP